MSPLWFMVVFFLGLGFAALVWGVMAASDLPRRRKRG